MRTQSLAQFLVCKLVPVRQDQTEMHGATINATSVTLYAK